MRLLLDTHIALWAIADDPRLPDAARQLIVDPESEIIVSAATIWEIAIKHALARGGPNDMPISGQQALHHFATAGYGLLNVTPSHAASVELLPAIHDDPFDRILVAQALAVPLRLLTRDARLAGYGDFVVVV
jgi:PIN domain nuclease of toxin-antitoxin system